VLRASAERIKSLLSDDDVVLDVGGWARPFSRADWVLDLMPYESRGLYGERDPDPERFTPGTWIQRDICAREPWPFGDEEFDFAICSQTLEDVRDPIWVCSELVRVAKAGYIEVPSRLEEQSYGVHGPWVGWSHHRWLVDVSPEGVEFVFKPHLLQGRKECYFTGEFGAGLSDEERVQTLFWTGAFSFRERIFMEADELDRYLAAFVAGHAGLHRERLRRRSLVGRVRRRLAELLGCGAPSGL
jgi:hypothetical protein